MNLSTFIFDWSGVISDDRRPVYETNIRLLKRYGKPGMTFEEWLPKTTLSVREFLANHGVIEDPDKLFEEYRKLLNQVRKENIHPIIYKDAIKALRKLSGMGKELIVVSSHPENNLRQEAKEYNVKKYFSLFLGNAKDKTETIFKACRQLDILPSNRTVAYVGDTIYDIQAAKKAKVYSIGIATGYHVKERLQNEKPDKIVDNLTQLLSI